MEKVIKKLKTISDEYSLSINQTMYIIGSMYNVDYSDYINSDDLLELEKNEIVQNNKVNEEIKIAIDLIINSKDEKVSKDKKSKFFSEESKKAYDMLFNGFIKKYDDDILNKYASYLKDTSKEKTMSKAFMVFHFIMPSSSSELNRNWEGVFNVNYTGVTLRRLTNPTAKKFKTLYTKKGVDTGLLCLALFKFVKDGISDGKCFIKKLETFWKEFDFWYEEAEKSVIKLNNLKPQEYIPGRRLI